MLHTIETINTKVNNFVWGIPAMVCILGVGLYLSICTEFIHFRKLGYSIKMTLEKFFTQKEPSDGSITPFQAMCTALSSTVGTGNIAGVAGAIALGGPGAVFWMWVSAFLGMCTKFAEIILAVHFREKNEKGDWVGGPMYYIKNGLGKNWKWMAGLYAVFGILTVFGTGNATQANTIITAIDSVLLNYNMVDNSQLKAVNLILGISIAGIVALVLLGGIKRIGKVAEAIVPFMILLYIILGIGVIVFNITKLPTVLLTIFQGAFHPAAVTGGVIGTMFTSMSRGVSRGIFSNEAGLGTSSIAHATADTSKPVKQGLYGIFEVFADTIIICTLTATTILISESPIIYGQAAGAELAINGFVVTYGNWVTLFTAIALVCFAFSTILGWGLYGTRCIEFLFGSKVNKPFMIVYSFVAIVGATMDLELLWGIADTFNGLMAIPNLIGLFLLSPVVFNLTKEYFSPKN